MQKQKHFRLFFCAAIITLLNFYGFAQENIDLSVAGVKLGDRTSAKSFLENYSSRIGEDGRPVFLFYNKNGTEVLKLVSASAEDLYFITEIEIFMVGRSYQSRLYIAEKFDSFETENEIFLGLRQSAASLLFGVPKKIGTKDLVKKKGEPKSRVKNDKNEILYYEKNGIEILGESAKYNYSASYEFYKNTLKKIKIKISQ